MTTTVTASKGSVADAVFGLGEDSACLFVEGSVHWMSRWSVI
jgi:hypothetical protein